MLTAGGNCLPYLLVITPGKNIEPANYHNNSANKYTHSAIFNVNVTPKGIDKPDEFCIY